MLQVKDQDILSSNNLTTDTLYPHNVYRHVHQSTKTASGIDELDSFSCIAESWAVSEKIRRVTSSSIVGSDAALSDR